MGLAAAFDAVGICAGLGDAAADTSLRHVRVPKRALELQGCQLRPSLHSCLAGHASAALLPSGIPLQACAGWLPPHR